MVSGPTPRSSPLTLVGYLVVVVGLRTRSTPFGRSNLPGAQPRSRVTFDSPVKLWELELQFTFVAFFLFGGGECAGHLDIHSIHSFASKGHTRQDLCLALVILQQKP